MKQMRYWILTMVLVLLCGACSPASEEQGKVEEPEVIEKEAAEETKQKPSKEEVLAMREKVLEGMAEEEIERLTLNIKDLNVTWESLYFYSDIFSKLEDPESLYWNYIDDSGEILLGYAENEDGTTAEVTAFNRFDWESFSTLIQDMQQSVQSEELKKELDALVEAATQAHETHEMEYAKTMFHILHDLDYFLLRYGIEDVGEYMQDKSFVATYYGALSLYEE